MAVEQATDHQAEFDKAFVMVNAPEAEKKEEAAPEPEVIVEAQKEPAEETKETVEEEESAEEEISSEQDPVVKTKSVDFEQKWKSQKGIVKAKDAKIAEAEKLIAEKNAEIERLRLLAEKANTPPVTEEKKDDISDKIDTLEEEYLEAVLNASSPEEKKNVIKLRKQLDGLKFQQFKESIKQETTEKVTSTISKMSEDEKFNSVVNDSYSKYPFLDNSNEETMNVHAIRLVRATRDDYISQGMSKAEALAKAVVDVAPMFVTKKAKATITAKEEPEIDADKIQSTVAVKTSSAPVKVAGKPKGVQTYDEGFDSVNPFGK